MTFVKPIENLERRTLLSAGDFDPTFGLGGQAGVTVPGFENPSIAAIDAGPNGRTIVGGTIGDGTRALLAVFDSAGNLVKSFSGDGVETEVLANQGGVIDLYARSDNKIIVLARKNVSGIELSGDAVLARFNANGTLDTTFGGGDGQVVLPF